MQNIKIILWEKRESSAVNKYGLDTKNVKCLCLASVTLSCIIHEKDQTYFKDLAMGAM